MWYTRQIKVGLFFWKYSRVPRAFPSCQPKANVQNHRELHCIVGKHGAKVITVISFAMWKILYTTLNKVSISLADSFYYQFPKLGSPFIWENPHCCDRSFIPLDSFCSSRGDLTFSLRDQIVTILDFAVHTALQTLNSATVAQKPL